MFALSEIYSSGDSPSIRFFKPWWDLVIDYLNLGMLLLMLIAFANVTLVDGEGIICIGIHKTYTWAQVRNISSYLEYNSLLRATIVMENVCEVMCRMFCTFKRNYHQ